jgi:hypothetical protein
MIVLSSQDKALLLPGKSQKAKALRPGANGVGQPGTGEVAVDSCPNRVTGAGRAAKSARRHGEPVVKATASPPTETQDTTISWHPTVQLGLKRSEGMNENSVRAHQKNMQLPGQPALWHLRLTLSSQTAG